MPDCMPDCFLLNFAAWKFLDEPKCVPDHAGQCRAHCRTYFWISGLMLDIYVVNFVPKFLRTDDRTDYWTVFGLILPSGSAQLYAVLQERS